jgi:hypothetical protein
MNFKSGGSGQIVRDRVPPVDRREKAVDHDNGRPRASSTFTFAVMISASISFPPSRGAAFLTFASTNRQWRGTVEISAHCFRKYAIHSGSQLGLWLDLQQSACRPRGLALAASAFDLAIGLIVLLGLAIGVAALTVSLVGVAIVVIFALV